MNIIYSLFFTGLFFGVGPCLVSCGPLLLSYITGTKKGVRSGLGVYLLFSLGRISVYLVLSLLIFLGKIAFGQLSGGILRYLLVLGGFFLILIGILICAGKNFEFKPAPAIFGLMVGIYPCAPLVALFSYIGLVSSTWLQSVIYSLSFGIGTFISPLILLAIGAGFFPRILQRRPLVYRIFGFVCGVVIIYLGTQLIYKATLTPGY
jgi:threonine/homoserine/homoserine lactone efflux protein